MFWFVRKELALPFSALLWLGVWGDTSVLMFLIRSGAKACLVMSRGQVLPYCRFSYRPLFCAGLFWFSFLFLSRCKSYFGGWHVHFLLNSILSHRVPPLTLVSRLASFDKFSLLSSACWSSNQIDTGTTPSCRPTATFRRTSTPSTRYPTAVLIRRRRQQFVGQQLDRALATSFAVVSRTNNCQPAQAIASFPRLQQQEERERRILRFLVGLQWSDIERHTQQDAAKTRSKLRCTRMSWMS